MTAQKIHEVVGVFTDFEKMEEAIDKLEISGFSRADISVLGNETALKKAFGNKIPDTKELEDNPKTPRSVNVAQEELGIAQGVLIGGGMIAGVVAVAIASGGVAVPGIATSLLIGGGAGTAVGSFLAKMLGDKYREFFDEQIEKGGLLLWVRTDNKKKEEQAHSILKEHNAKDIHTHNI